MRKSTMPRFRFSRLLVFALALCAVLATAGCDSNSEADEEDFAVFERGDWEVRSFRVGSTDRTGRLRNQYDSNVIFGFFEESDNDDREFEIFARRSGGTDDDLLVEGELDIDGGDDEMDFFPNNSPRFQVDYEILRSNRIVLTTEEDKLHGRRIRDLLLPNSTVGDEFPRVRLVIERR
jgi:hypothetical protein